MGAAPPAAPAVATGRGAACSESCTNCRRYRSSAPLRSSTLHACKGHSGIAAACQTSCRLRGNWENITKKSYTARDRYPYSSTPTPFTCPSSTLFPTSFLASFIPLDVPSTRFPSIAHHGIYPFISVGSGGRQAVANKLLSRPMVKCSTLGT